MSAEQVKINIIKHTLLEKILGITIATAVKTKNVKRVTEAVEKMLKKRKKMGKSIEIVLIHFLFITYLDMHKYFILK